MDRRWASADRNSLAGVVRAVDGEGQGAGRLRALTGCRLDFADGTPSLLVYPSDREAYGRLTRLLTVGQLRAEKGECHLCWEDFLEARRGPAGPGRAAGRAGRSLRDATCTRHAPASCAAGSGWPPAAAYAAQDLKRLARLAALARDAGAPMVATNDVLYHGPERRPLQDVLTCIREGCTIHEAGLPAGGQRRASPQDRRRDGPAVRPLAAARWSARPRSPSASASTSASSSYEYPDEPVPPGKTGDPAPDAT